MNNIRVNSYFVLIAIFGIGASPIIAQTHNVKTKNLKNILNSCVEKVKEIDYACIPTIYNKDSTIYFLKIMQNEKDSDSILITVGEPWLTSYLESIHDSLRCFLDLNNCPMLLYSTMRFINIDQALSCSLDVTQVIKDKIRHIPAKKLRRYAPPKVFLFSFHKDLLVKGSGSIFFKVYYPLSTLDRKLWPLEYNDIMPLPEIDSIEVYFPPPWGYCNCYRFINQPIINKTQIEIEQMKAGIIIVKKRRFPSWRASPDA